MPGGPKRDDPVDLRQGTLDLLILGVLAWGPTHGHNIVKGIERASGQALLVDHGSLYPALQRLEAKGWIEAEWGASDTNRRARFYELTKAGRKELAGQSRQWRRLAEAIGRILGPSEA